MGKWLPRILNHDRFYLDQIILVHGISITQSPGSYSEPGLMLSRDFDFGELLCQELECSFDAHTVRLTTRSSLLPRISPNLKSLTIASPSLILSLRKRFAKKSLYMYNGDRNNNEKS